jgi:dipeptidyl aminopeptidase/acylaminoacyl peptidase
MRATPPAAAVVWRSALCAVLVVPASLAQQQQGAAPQPSANYLKLEQYLDWEDVQAPQLSPDGKQVVYTRRWVDKMNDSWQSSLWIMGIDGSRNRFLVNGADARWSPDGARIAYLAKGEPAGTQLFVRWMDGEGSVSQLTHLTETPPCWFPRATAGTSRCPPLPRERSGPSRRA